MLSPRSRPVALLLALVVALTVLAGSPGSARADDERVPDGPIGDVPIIPSKCLGHGPIPENQRPCQIEWHGKNAPTVVIWGDSHAWQHVPALRAAARGKVNIVGFLLGSCPPVYLTQKEAHQPRRLTCEKLAANALSYVTKLKQDNRRFRLVLGSAWGAYRDQWRDYQATHQLPPGEVAPYRLRMAQLAFTRTNQLFNVLGRRGIPTDVVTQGVITPLDAPDCAAGNLPYACDFPRAGGLPRENANKARLRWLIRKLPRGARLIDPNGVVCGTSICHGMQDGIYTFYDEYHISATRSATFAPFYQRTFQLAKKRVSRR